MNAEIAIEVAAEDAPICFTRVGPDAFELDVAGPLLLTAAEVRALARRLEAEAGAAFARTMRRPA